VHASGFGERSAKGVDFCAEMEPVPAKPIIKSAANASANLAKRDKQKRLLE